MTKDINFALVEETRPAIYASMKYWGKKPHNIWRKYIENYTPENGLFFDPFAGSATSAFEAVKAGRKAVAFDLNPLTSFFIEVIGSEFDFDLYKEAVETIVSEIESDDVYQTNYTTKCNNCNSKATIINFKWDQGKIYEIAVECSDCTSGSIGRRNRKHRFVSTPGLDELANASKISTITNPYWSPDKVMPSSVSFNAAFLRVIGGNKFSDLWTKRNLYIISKIYDLILKQKDHNVKLQLLSSFIQTIHLTTKMCVPRRPGANRAFSTSWGRSAFIAAARQMEMNPLTVFLSSSFGKQSTESMLKHNFDYLGKKPKLLYVDKSNRSNRSSNFDIKYGVIDINNISDYLDEKSVDFIMTDPPYGGLVQYLDLSSLWLCWLEKFDARYIPNYDAEITIKGRGDLESYRLKFLNGLRQLHKVLKDDGKIVFTFHNKEIAVWNIFLNSVIMAGFQIEKVTHQQNKRTGESNVANPYGTSASDFYIRCTKADGVKLENENDEFDHFVVTTAIHIIAERNEPTPYQILFNGLLAVISSAGFKLDGFDATIEKILSKEVGKTFTLTQNEDNNAGSYWWFVDPDQFIKYPDIPLTERVEETIKSLLRRKVSVTLDEVLAEIFINYPNGLTPEIRSITSTLAKYASQSGGKWQYRAEQIEQEYTQHTFVLSQLSSIGKKLGHKIYIGKREQSEPINGGKLSQFADFTSLEFLPLVTEQRKRVEMIDMLWLNDQNQIVTALEVENCTNFTSGIQRASNLGEGLNKIMVVPDSREKELKSISDILFTHNFDKYNWKFINYTDVEKIKLTQGLKHEDISRLLRGL